ncbi:hypothetical protein CDAR_205551 [Caerostris darwini]|uniref:Uncharacterized protein n=1 Tax=Caerostris darwini TaxID=1538125 RepID=A0AAV4WTQ4_9ARAC|nr:hypothetical protein CDAR_205551 [Caerostris darwini]
MRKTGVSCRISSGPSKTVKESGVADRKRLQLNVVPDVRIMEKTGLYLSHRIWNLSPAPPTPTPPPQTCTEDGEDFTTENKKFCSRKFAQDIAPRAPELTLALPGGWRMIFPRWQSLIRYLVGDRPHTGKLASPTGKLPTP